MTKIEDTVCCVVDHGLFVPVAAKLAEQFKHVYYFSPWEKDFPSVRDGLIGSGFDNMTRVNSVWDVKSKCNLFAFFDIGFSGMQKELRASGMPVWGGFEADSFEINRGKFFDELEALDMPVPKHVEILGLAALREYLRDKEDKWIKISKWRGDVETCHWDNWEDSNGMLDIWAYKLGPVQDLFNFYVLDSIATTIEDGIDTYCIDGQLPKICMHGMEAKDKAYLSTIAPVECVSPKVSEVSRKFSQSLKPYGYRQFFSTEVRIAEEANYFIDPTLRMGSPPSQLMIELFDNLGEIIVHGASGHLVEPVPIAEFGVQAAVGIAHGERTSWSSFTVPESIRQWLKCGTCFKIKEQLCFAPDEDNMIGWLVAVGNSIEDAIDTLKERIEELPKSLSCDLSEMAGLLNEVKAAEKRGMEFTPQEVPNAASIVK